MVANTWIAAAPGNWSDDANWSLGHSPIAGEDPTFDGTSVNNCAANDDTPCGVLTIAAGYSGTITQSSDMYIGGYSQAGGTFTGLTTKWVYCSGDFTQSAGTFTNGLSSLYFNTDAVLTKLSSGGIVHLKTDSTITLSGTGLPTFYSITILDGGNLIIPSGKTAYMSFSAPSSKFINNGVISGDGTLIYKCVAVSANPNVYLNDTNTNIVFTNIVAVDFVFGLYTDGNIKSLTISSGHAVNTCTLDLNGHSLTATTITVGTRGILANSAATDSVISCNSLDSSAGTFTPDRTVLVMEDASTLKLAAGGTVDNLLSKSVTTLASDVTVSNVCAHVNPINKGAFALTLTKPNQEYTGMKRPIIIPVKQLAIGAVTAASRWLRDLGAVI